MAKPTVSKSWAWWPLARIKPFPDNPRTHPDEQIELLAQIFKKFGPDQAIVVDERGVILKGHGRLLAAARAKLDSFPVIERRGLSDADKHAIRVQDNQVALMSGWNEALLSEQIGELKLGGYDLSLLGFSEGELLEMLDPTVSAPRVSLREAFGVVPFSVLNARDGWWQERKRAWIAIGIQSEVGRGENLLKFSDSVSLDGATYKARAARRKNDPRNETASLKSGLAVHTTADPYRAKNRMRADG